MAHDDRTGSAAGWRSRGYQRMSERLRIRGAAAHLGISPRSLADRAWRLRHGIPAARVGRAVVFDRVALDRWLAKHQERSLRETSEVDDLRPLTGR